jgi:hypothetical protein
MYSLNIRWIKSQINPEIIEDVLSQAGDWLRFDAWSWLVYSSYSAHDISSALQRKLSAEDSILIIACDPNDYNGFAQQWVWDWINKYRTPIPERAGLGEVFSGNALNPTGGLFGLSSGNALSNLLSKKTDS